MAGKEKRRISLDEVASGRLSERILKQIENIELTVEEVVEWERSKPAFRFTLTERQLDFLVRKRVRWNSKRTKIVATVSTAIGAIWVFIQYLLPHLTT